MGRITLALLVMLLAGCGMAQQMQTNQQAEDAQAKRIAAVTACKSKFPTVTTKPAVEGIRCRNEADLEYHLAMERSVGHPGLDLVRIAHAKRLSLAEQYDAGKLTPSQYELAVAQVESEATSSIQARMNSAAMANAAQQQAMAARQQAAMQGVLAGAAVMTGGVSGPAPAHRTTSCRPLGGTLHCNHY